jgi:DNA-directed RNA polymerase subunit K/omega
MKPNKLPLFELMIGDEATDEIFAISLVESPAIELDFQYFGKELIRFAEVNKDKRLIMGPILVPNKRIFRIDGEGKEYEVYFKPETVRRLSQMYLEKKYTDSATIEHDTKKIKGINLVESWIVDNKFQDKSKAFGFQVPEGTWMGVFRVDESPAGKNIWDDYVKTGKVKGFSIEGMFEHSLVAAAKVEEQLWSKDINELDEEEAQILLGKIKAIISKDKRYKGKQRVEMESYSDYGDGIKNNAKRGIELNEKNGNKCATQTGKVRAQQLANGEPISVETIKRMYSYLSRAAEYYDETDTTACGTISYLLWGGKAALSWSRNKLRELGVLQENEAQPSITSTYPGEAAGDKKKKKYVSPALLEVEDGELNILGYHTKNFKLCPGAIGLFNHLIEMPMDDDTIGMVRSAAQIADNVFHLENIAIESGIATQHQYEEAVILVDDFKDLMHEIDEEVGMMHDVSFMDGHIEKIKSYVK